MNKTGIWTEKVKIVKDNLKDSEVVTEDGEVVKLHEKTIVNLAIDIVNYAEQLNGTDEATLLSEKQMEILKQMEERSSFHNRLLDTYGNFYFNFYKRIDIESQYLFRFIYICSYMNYDNYLTNGKRLLNKDDLQDILLLGKSEYYKTRDYLLKKELIFIDDKDLVRINSKYCKKGKINKTKVVEVIRMFNDSIQEIYQKALPREHKKLAILLDILPYINYKYNIICYNPTEDQIELIKPIKMGDLCEMLGYERSNASRIKKLLFSLKVNGEKVIGMWQVEDVDSLLVNPRVYYKGGEDNGLDYLEALFKVNK